MSLPLLSASKCILSFKVKRTRTINSFIYNALKGTWTLMLSPRFLRPLCIPIPSSGHLRKASHNTALACIPRSFYLFLLKPLCYYVYTTNLGRKKCMAIIGKREVPPYIVIKMSSLPRADSNPANHWSLSSAALLLILAYSVIWPHALRQDSNLQIKCSQFTLHKAHIFS